MIKDIGFIAFDIHNVSRLNTNIIIFFPITKQRIIDQTINDFTVKNSGDSKLYIFSKLITACRVRVKIFLDNKFFCVGPRQFRNECKKYQVSEFSCDTHPHHTY